MKIVLSAVGKRIEMIGKVLNGLSSIRGGGERRYVVFYTPTVSTIPSSTCSTLSDVSRIGSRDRRVILLGWVGSIP